MIYHNISDYLFDDGEIITLEDWYNFGVVDYILLMEPTKSNFESLLRIKKSFWRFIK